MSTQTHKNVKINQFQNLSYEISFFIFYFNIPNYSVIYNSILIKNDRNIVVSALKYFYNPCHFKQHRHFIF